MKDFLFFIALLLSIHSKAQTSVYHPFPDSNAYWCQSLDWYDGSCFQSKNFTIYFSGDTSINGISYHKLSESGFGYSPDCGGSAYYHYDFVGAIRQDTSQKKVFIYDNTFNVDTIFFDFNLQIGDTLDRSKVYWLPQNNLHVVTSIDSILISGDFRKRFNFNACPDSSIIEGLGSTSGLFSVPSECFEYWARLNGFKQNGIVLYPDSSSSCNIISGIKNASKKNSLSIFPNPARNNFTISSNFRSPASSLEIYNMLGEKVYERTITLKQETINCSSFSPGIYFVKVISNEMIYSEKLIIE